MCLSDASMKYKTFKIVELEKKPYAFIKYYEISENADRKTMKFWGLRILFYLLTIHLYYFTNAE